MAATKEVLDLIEQIFDQASLALNPSYTERVRQLGDSSCRAGIEAAMKFLSEKSELSDGELRMLSAGTIPEHIKQRDFEAHIEPLKERTNSKLDEKDIRLCSDAFDSGLSAAMQHLLRIAKNQQVDLLSLVPSNGK